MIIFLFLFSIFQNNCLIFVDRSSPDCCQNGTNEFPFQNLSFALQNSLSSSDLIFVLVSNDISYDFFDILPIPSNITITSSLYNINNEIL